MGIFEKFGFKKPKLASEEEKVSLIKNEIDILSEDLKKRNWTEVWYSISSTDLNSLSKDDVNKLDPESQRKLKNVVRELKTVFETEKEGIKKDIAPEIERAINKLSEAA